MALSGTVRSHAAQVLCRLLEPVRGERLPAPRLVAELLSDCSEDECAVLGRAVIAYGLVPVPDDADAELLREVATVRFGGVPEKHPACARVPAALWVDATAPVPPRTRVAWRLHELSPAEIEAPMTLPRLPAPELETIASAAWSLDSARRAAVARRLVPVLSHEPGERRWSAETLGLLALAAPELAAKLAPRLLAPCGGVRPIALSRLELRYWTARTPTERLALDRVVEAWQQSLRRAATPATVLAVALVRGVEPAQRDVLAAELVAGDPPGLPAGLGVPQAAVDAIARATRTPEAALRVLLRLPLLWRLDAAALECWCRGALGWVAPSRNAVDLCFFAASALHVFGRSPARAEQLAAAGAARELCLVTLRRALDEPYDPGYTLELELALFRTLVRSSLATRSGIDAELAKLAQRILRDHQRHAGDAPEGAWEVVALVAGRGARCAAIPYTGPA